LGGGLWEMKGTSGVLWRKEWASRPDEENGKVKILKEGGQTVVEC